MGKFNALLPERMEDNYLQVRAEDIRGIGRRLLMYLQGKDWKLKSYPKQCILVGEEISAARIADVPVGQLAGSGGWITAVTNPRQMR